MSNVFSLKPLTRAQRLGLHFEAPWVDEHGFRTPHFRTLR
jgi:hypothetical protein